MQDNKLSIKEEFELREKRIKLMYKVLYIVVAILGAMILIVASGVPNNLNAIAILSLCLTFFSVVTFKILQYVFAEFRCLKIKAKPENILCEKAETLYDNIWKSFSVVLILSFFLMIIHYFIFKYLTLEKCVLTSAAFAGLGMGTYLINFFVEKESERILILRNIFFLVAVYFFFVFAVMGAV